MKVLAISVSLSSGGNSDVLCDRFLKGAEEAGHQTEKIRLDDKNISPCKACYGCGKSKTCVIKDDMAELLQKLVEAMGKDAGHPCKRKTNILFQRAACCNVED